MNKFFAVIPASLALFAASCTVSEPAEDGAATSAGARLESLAFYGQKLVKVSYDSQNRVSEIRVGTPDEYDLYRISYNPLVVESEEWEEVSEWDPETGDYVEDVMKMRSKERWGNISLNDAGAIVSMTVTSTDYTVSTPDGSNVEVETEAVRCVYDAQGHLSRMTAGTDVTTLTWDAQGRLLTVEYVESDFDHNGSYTGEWSYSNVANTRLQWDPMLPLVGPMQITGLFGKAPSYFVKSVSNHYPSGWTELIQFSYRVDDNGFIRQSVYADYDNISMQYRWNYIN